MLLITRRLATGLLLVPICGIRFAGAASAATARITLTKLIPPDTVVPGSHEFDFGKATFLQRMAEAKFPLYAANLRGPDGQALPNLKDRSIVTVDGVRIGLAGATYDDSARAADPGDLRFL